MISKRYEIDQPDIQEKLTKLLISESEISEESSSDNSIDEIGNISESSIESQELSDNLCNCKTINVITKDIDKQFLLDIIDKIDDRSTSKERAQFYSSEKTGNGKHWLMCTLYRN